MRGWLPFAGMFVVGSAAGVVGLRLVPLPGITGGGNPHRQSAEADAPQDQDAATAIHHEIRALRQELANLRTATGGRGDAARNEVDVVLSTGDPSAPPGQPTGTRTLAYWNELNAIMAKEAAMRAAPPQITAENALAFVGGRTRAFQFAGPAIRELNAHGVDPQVTAIARDIAEWYEAGLAIGQEAESLLGTADVATRQGSRGVTWRSREEQHRQRCLEINRRGEQVRRAMSQKYGLDFPKLL